MQRIVFVLFLISGLIAQAQEWTAEKTGEHHLDADFFYGADEFGFIYYKKNEVLFKEKGLVKFSYQNINLGEITSVSLQNPLKIILFYRDYSSIVILDNRLNELLDPVTVQMYNVSLAGYASENNIWLYSEDQNILQLFNYRNKKINLNTQPLGFYHEGFFARELVSNNDNIWLTSDEGVLQFNQYSSFIDFFPFQHIRGLQAYKQGFAFLQHNNLFYFNGKSKIHIAIQIENVPESFSIRGNKLYLFSKHTLSQYNIKE